MELPSSHVPKHLPSAVSSLVLTEVEQYKHLKQTARVCAVREGGRSGRQRLKGHHELCVPCSHQSVALSSWRITVWQLRGEGKG